MNTSSSDLPPQLSEIHTTSEFKVPTLSTTTHDPISSDLPTSNGTATAQPAVNSSSMNGSTAAETAKGHLVNAKDTVTASEYFAIGNSRRDINVKIAAQQAASTIANHPVTQNVKQTISEAPITQVASDQAAKTSAEFDNLKNSRQTPKATLANDQPMTHYHSFFYTLLSWENPRVTGIAFGLSILTIFAFRYVPALRWTFKSLYLILGTVALVEGVTKLVFGAGVAQSMRPKRYVTIPREALEASLEDVEQLLNFFVIEFQRILYAENVLHTTLAFIVSFISYYLIKFVPTWGLMLLGTSLIYSVPLIYITNKEAIDHHLANANEVVSAQAKQVREIATQQTSSVAETVKNVAGDYTAKAQEMVGGKRSPSPQATFKAPVTQSSSSIKAQDFPAAPKNDAFLKTEPAFPVAPKKDPIVAEVAAAHTS